MVPVSYKLIIKDNGKGIPAEYLQNNAETLGMELISILSEQLEESTENICRRGNEN